jgi:hypothetical protein
MMPSSSGHHHRGRKRAVWATGKDALPSKGPKVTKKQQERQLTSEIPLGQWTPREGKEGDTIRFGDVVARGKRKCCQSSWDDPHLGNCPRLIKAKKKKRASK